MTRTIVTTVSSILVLSLFNSNSTLIFIIFLLSPTNKDDDIGNIFRNNNPALQQADSTEGVGDDDDDDNDDNPWVLNDGKYLFYIYLNEIPLSTSLIFLLFYFSFCCCTHTYI